MGKAHTPGGPAEADHRLWEPPRDSPAPPRGTNNRRPATEVEPKVQPGIPRSRMYPGLGYTQGMSLAGTGTPMLASHVRGSTLDGYTIFKF